MSLSEADLKAIDKYEEELKRSEFWRKHAGILTGLVLLTLAGAGLWLLLG